MAIQVGYIIYSLHRKCIVLIHSAYRLNKKWRKARDLEGNRDEQEYNVLMQDSSLVSLPVTWQYVAHLTGGELVLV